VVDIEHHQRERMVATLRLLKSGITQFGCSDCSRVQENPC
jgi:Uri superfamily endonuclease